MHRARELTAVNDTAGFMHQSEMVVLIVRSTARSARIDTNTVRNTKTNKKETHTLSMSSHGSRTRWSTLKY